MKNIFFIMPQLGGGGGERVISILLNNFDRSQYIPNLVILKKTGSNEFLKDLEEDVVIHYLDIKMPIKISFIWIIFKLLNLCYKMKPDVMFFGSGQINVLFSPFLFLFPKNIRFIARESNLPSKYEKYFFLKILYKYFYKNYDKIIVQSDDMFNDLNINFGLPKSNLTKINNPVDFDYIKNKLNKTKEIGLSKSKLNLIVVGRLTYQKGFDILIKELSKVNGINYHLNILGDGEDKEELIAIRDKYNLENQISFLGNVSNPYQYMQLSDIFILSSRFEGFPNVVLESLSCGTPVLANNCLGGISEIIKPEFNGEIFSFENKNFEEKLKKIINMNINKQNIIKDAEKRFSITHKIKEFQNVMEF